MTTQKTMYRLVGKNVELAKFYSWELKVLRIKGKINGINRTSCLSTDHQVFFPGQDSEILYSSLFNR